MTLLEKYMRHVIDCESWSFLENIGSAGAIVEFTPDELAELQALADKIFADPNR